MDNTSQTFKRLGITADTLRAYDQRIPRYTSYPTAPVWTDAFRGREWATHLETTASAGRPLSLYVHIPFCQKRCLFCACNVIATRREGIADAYLDDVEREVALAARHARGVGHAIQLHLGGGTPNYLTGPEMDRLIAIVERHFDFAPDAERSIEVDPRTATREDIFRLRQVNRFDRISFGVQDFSDDTQEAIGREQSGQLAFDSVLAARDAGFASINIDLIYGLPRQTPESWKRTLDDVCALQPDRLALYNFAWLPSKVPNQRGIEESELPEPATKLDMFIEAHDRLTSHGWRFLGMDHYAREQDSLTRAFEAGTMRRNFMGYTTLRGTDLLGFGVSAIGDFGGAFAQNTKKLTEYAASLDEGILPVERGMKLSVDDLVRRDCIESLMCQGRLDLAKPWLAALVQEARAELEDLERQGLLTLSPAALDVTLKGRVFLRNIAVVFDASMRAMKDKHLFSRAV